MFFFEISFLFIFLFFIIFLYLYNIFWISRFLNIYLIFVFLFPIIFYYFFCGIIWFLIGKKTFIIFNLKKKNNLRIIN